MAKKRSSNARKKPGRPTKKTQHKTAEPKKEKPAQPVGIKSALQSQSTLSKLDPVLMLSAEHAPGAIELEEIPSVMQTLPGLATAANKITLGVRSMTSQMSRLAGEHFLKEDLVPILVRAEQAEELSAQIQSWQGTAETLTPSIVSACVPRSRLHELAGMDSVRYVEASVKLKPASDLAHVSARLIENNVPTVPQTGEGVLVGIIDTGIDTNHPAFRTADGTRIVDYFVQETGERYSADRINAGDAANSPDLVGHGSHVAGIAAGNGAGSVGNEWRGVASEADLAIVKTTFDSKDIASAVKHIFALADERSQPCVVNLSLGGHVGGHDGTSITERTIDELSGSGRIVVASAGNEGDHPIHAHTVLIRNAQPPQPWIAKFRLTAQTFETDQGQVAAGLLFLQVWHQHEDAVKVQLRTPTGSLISAPHQGRQEFSFGSIFVEAIHQIHPYSGDHSTSFRIITDPQPQVLGGWSLMVEEDQSNGGVNVGSVHAWIRDISEGSFTTGATRSHLIGIPGTSFAAITVASYATRGEWASQAPNSPGGTFRAAAVNLEDISYFSSIGPSRDGHNKPEIAAPGQFLMAPLSADATISDLPLLFRHPNHPYAAQQGTSMSAPYVTGALALLLQRDPNIDWAEAKRRLIKSVRQDGFTLPCWNARWGYGKIDVRRLLTIEPVATEG